MEIPRFPLVGLGLMLSLSAQPSSACSVTYVPTNFELVAESKNIAIGKAVLAKKVTLEGQQLLVDIEIIRVLRGSGVTVGQRIRIGSWRGRYYGASEKYDFSQPRRGALRGSCVAHDYDIGKHYLVFLEFDPQKPKWSVGGPALSRLNEEVEPEGDPWTTAVTKYIEIADLPTDEQRCKAFEELIARGSRADANPTDKAIAIDVKSHIMKADKKIGCCTNFPCCPRTTRLTR